MCTIKQVLMVFLLICFPAINAHAYLDPGTGSIIFQAIVASVAVGLFTIKSWWYRLVDLVKRRRDSEDEPGESNRPD